LIQWLVGLLPALAAGVLVLVAVATALGGKAAPKIEHC
jgi:hypothetical protein